VCVYLHIDSGIFYTDTDISARDTYVCVIYISHLRFRSDISARDTYVCVRVRVYI